MSMALNVHVLVSNVKNNSAIINGINGLFTKIDTSTDVANRISDYCKGAVGQVAEEICANAPEELLKLCKKDKTRDCDTLIREGVEMFCKENSESPACDWLPATTANTTSGSGSLPFKIGGIVALIIILAVGAGLFFYCRNKKKKTVGNGQTMTGTTVGSTSATGTTKTGTSAVTETGSRY